MKKKGNKISDLRNQIPTLTLGKSVIVHNLHLKDGFQMKVCSFLMLV